MALTEQDFADDMHPIDIVEILAAEYEWEFSRVGSDQITMAVDGQWKTYSITLAWSGYDQTLRLICTFDLEPPEDRLPALFEMTNSVNDQCWVGSFSYWGEHNMMAFRYGLVTEGGIVGIEQINTLIATAVSTAERYYPAFQLILWGN
ncbi:MAG: YbjN domain-containing protein, partial [Paracoccus sp. (in: a-proteobacteria)]